MSEKELKEYFSQNNQRSFEKNYLMAKFRYRQPEVPVEIFFLENFQKLKVRFSKKQRALTPGQYAVFYKNEVCMGGGVITETEKVNQESEPRNRRIIGKEHLI